MPDELYILTHDYYDPAGEYQFTESIIERGDRKEFHLSGKFIPVTHCVALLHHQLAREKLNRQSRKDGEGRF